MYLEICLKCAYCPCDGDCGIWCNQLEMLHVIFCCISVAVFFPFFYGSSLPFMVFKANIHLMSLYLQYVCGRENYSVQSSVIWRQRYTTTSLSKKQKRKDRYNCMCVCVLSMQDNSNTGWVWWMRAVCVQPSSNTQLAGREYLCAMCHAHKSNQRSGTV